MGLEVLGLADLVSFTLPTNAQSRRVMGKAGFRYAFARFHFWRLTARVGDRTVWDVEHDPVMNGNRFANPAAMKKVYNSYHAELGK